MFLLLRATLTSFLQILLFLLLFNGYYSLPTTSIEPDKQKRFPKAIIIGVKKAGTRALLEFLRLNPAIKAPGPEIHFFDKNYEKGFEWYRGQMPETTKSQLTLEKSPAYFISKSAPQRVYELDPAMKLIVVVRNPITRAISDYTQAISKRKRRSIMPRFESIAVKNSSSVYKDKKKIINTSWGAIRIGVYHQYISNWLKYFPLHQIHFVDGERLIKDPAAEVRSVEKFLGFYPTVHRSNFAIDPVKGFPCVLRPDKTLHCLGKTKGRPHPYVEPKIIDALRQYYEEENEKFFKLINRRFNW